MDSCIEAGCHCRREDRLGRCDTALSRTRNSLSRANSRQVLRVPFPASRPGSLSHADMVGTERHCQRNDACTKASSGLYPPTPRTPFLAACNFPLTDLEKQLAEFRVVGAASAQGTEGCFRWRRRTPLGRSLSPSPSESPKLIRTKKEGGKRTSSLWEAPALVVSKERLGRWVLPTSVGPWGELSPEGVRWTAAEIFYFGAVLQRVGGGEAGPGAASQTGC